MKIYEEKYRKNVTLMYSDQEITRLNQRYLTILRNMPIGKRILDIGCGNGEFTRHFFKKYEEVYGIDISETAVELARKKNIIAEQLDLDNCTKLPFEPKFFDTIVCTEVIEHLFNFQSVFKLFHEVLKDEGILIVTVPNAGWWRFRLNVLLGRSFYFSGKVSKELCGSFNEHIRFINVADMMRIIKPYFFIKKMIPQLEGGFTAIISRIWKSLAFRLIYLMKKEK
ncbi:MAG: class I SAM-dependent methyltransferase [Candidatus Hodarchaeota archaeon]